ncbi:MAG: hypothetical protein IJ527_03380 [Prevotella sp.]|nr:hypothetical protein [Prevotella sp.]
MSVDIQEFQERYYPELSCKDIQFLFLDHVQLQKNPWVCANFVIKHRKNDTLIKVVRTSNFWARLIGGPILLPFLQGDFYKELYGHFKEFLMKKYGYQPDEIKMKRFEFSKPWTLVGGYVVALLVTFLAAVGLNELMMPTYHGLSATETYEVVDSVLEDVVSPHYYLLHKPTGKIVADANDGFSIWENNGYAIVDRYDDYKYEFKYELFNSKGETVLDKRYDYLEFFSSEIIVALDDGDYVFFDFDGKQANNYRTWMLNNNGLVIAGIVALFVILMILTTIIWRRAWRK